jgi:hypothetical protein
MGVPLHTVVLEGNLVAFVERRAARSDHLEAEAVIFGNFVESGSFMMVGGQVGRRSRRESSRQVSSAA